MSVRLIHHQVPPVLNSRNCFPTSLRPISCLINNKSNNDDKRKPIKNPKKRRPPVISTATTMTDAQLALELAVEAERAKERADERENAMKKSTEMLFDELCEYLKMRSDREEVKRRWRRMPEDERRGLVAAFVSDWGVDFHPLSRRGVMQLLDEFVGVDGGDGISMPDFDSVAAFGMSGLKRLIGFVSG